MNIHALHDRERRMLELLSQGLGSREMAERLGYKDGTVRVYLHALYQRLGVPNRTSAVSWYFAQTKGQSIGAAPGAVEDLLASETFGDFAVRTNLRAALGMMIVFVGAQGRQWEVAMRLKGTAIDANVMQARRDSRALFEAYLGGDFAYAKSLADVGAAIRLIQNAPSDAVVLGCALLAGGFTYAADKLIDALPKKSASTDGAKLVEWQLLRAFRDALYGTRSGPLATLQLIAKEASANVAFRHLALATLFYAYLHQGDEMRAATVANVLWCEADIVRKQLAEIGEAIYVDAANLPDAPLVEQEAMSRYQERLKV
jgi:DNA-binding CsgD family transcriptional regulator